MTTAINGVNVRLGRDPEDFRRYQIVVQVYSARRPGLKSHYTIDPGKVNNKEHLLQLIATSASAGAEYLGQKYNDNIDPVRAGQYALQAFAEESRLIVELAKGAPAKVKRLETQVSLLNNQEQELLHKLRWAVDNNRQITVGENNWLNSVLGRIHGSQL
jgi:hypothetical protein